MKAYQKPTMLVLSISANDMLCSCSSNRATITILNDVTLRELLKGDYNNDGVVDRKDYEMLFVSAEENCTKTDIAITGYCKFTASASESSVIIYS